MAFVGRLSRACAVLLLAALLIACGGGGDGDGTSSPPPTAPNSPAWQPAAGATPATGNYVYLQSDAGDYIGQGRTYLYTARDALLSVGSSGTAFTMHVDGDEWWDASFVGPSSGGPLVVGYYPGLQRYPFHDASVGGLSWGGEGRGCNTLTGWIAVDSVTYVAGTLTAIELRFEQHCDGMAQALRGKLRWSANDATTPPGPVAASPSLWQPPAGTTPAGGNYVYLQSDFGDYIGAGQTALYTSSNAILTPSGGGGRFSLRVDGDESWSGDFQAMLGVAQLQPGYYADLQRYPFHNPAKGGLSWGGEGRGCNELRGWFVVDSVRYTSGVLSAIELRFEQHCEGAVAALRGKIRWTQSDVTAPAGPENPPPAGLWQPAAGATPASGNFVYLQSDFGDYIGGGATYLYTQADAVLVPSMRTGYFGVSVTGSVNWSGEFQAMLGVAQLQPGYYGNLQRYPFHNPAKGGLSWSGDGRGCNQLSGWFVVDSVSYLAGTLASIDLRFEQHCEGQIPALRGRIRWSL